MGGQIDFSTSQNARREGSDRHTGRILRGERLHRKVSGAACFVVLLRFDVGHMGGNRIAAGGGIRGLDLGNPILANDLASPGAGAPDIGERVLGIKVVGSDGCRDGLTYYDFIRLHSTYGTRGPRRSRDGAGMRLLISNKQVLLGIRVPLRRRRTPNE